jgi:anhydro-N-acetylmuramic acid kinase
LVPIGDELLFADYNNCINLGGFANISFNKNGRRQAYDICPVNIVLNELSQKLGMNYDPKGSLARKGVINEKLLAHLNKLPHYKQKSPKSLGKEWVIKSTLPLLYRSKSNPSDLLRTYTEHAAIQISKALQSAMIPYIQTSTLLSGGGTYNEFLIERIKGYSPASMFIPDKKTIEFKESLIFAFLGLLRWTNRINCLSSVTGAKADSVGGCIYL